MFKSCMDCVAPKRHPGCHSTCEEYKRERELFDKRQAKIKKEKNERSMALTCEIESKERIMRAARKYKDAKHYKHEY